MVCVETNNKLWIGFHKLFIVRNITVYTNVNMKCSKVYSDIHTSGEPNVTTIWQMLKTNLGSMERFLVQCAANGTFWLQGNVALFVVEMSESQRSCSLVPKSSKIVTRRSVEMMLHIPNYSGIRKERSKYALINTLRPTQGGRHYPDDIFKCFSLNENIWISIKISLKFAPKGQLTIFHHWFR